MLRIIEVFLRAKTETNRALLMSSHVAHIPDEYHVDQHVVTESILGQCVGVQYDCLNKPLSSDIPVTYLVIVSRVLIKIRNIL